MYFTPKASFPAFTSQKMKNLTKNLIILTSYFNIIHYFPVEVSKKNSNLKLEIYVMRAFKAKKFKIFKNDNF